MAKPKIQLIYIELDEEVDFLLQKISQSWSPNIVLIFPKGSHILSSLVSLRFLKNQIEGIGKNALSVIGDKGGRWMAEQAGMEAVDKLPDFEKMYGEGIVGGRPDEETEKNALELEEEIIAPVDEILPEEFIKEKREEIEEYWQEEPAETGFDSLAKMDKRISWRPKFKFSFPSIFSKVYLILVALAVVVAILVVYFVLPKVTLEVFPKKEVVSIPPMTVMADKSLSEANINALKIPAQVLSVQASDKKTFSATQEKNLDKKAVGTITVFNEFSASPQSLVATTRFRAPDGKIFRTQSNIIVPGATMVEGELKASSIDVAVVADKPGAEYNIGPTTFKIPGFEGGVKFDGFYGRSSSTMSGGGQDSARIVSTADIDQAKKSFDGLAARALGDLTKKTPENLKLIELSLEADNINYASSKSAGEVADSFDVEATVIARAIAINENALKEIIKNVIVSENPEVGANISIIDYAFDYEVKEVNLEKGQMLFDVKSEQTVVFVVDIEKLKKSLAGKSKGQANEIFSSMVEIQKVNVSFTPRWVKSFPKNENRIIVKFGE